MKNTLAYKDIILTHTGHSGIKIKKNNLIIYLDPFQIQDIEPADFIFISHEHYDHCDPESIQKIIQPYTTIYTSDQAASKLHFPNVKIVYPNSSTEDNGISIQAIPAYNTNKVFHPKEEKRVGFIITLDQIRIYHAGDTDLIPEMRKLNTINIAFLPISGIYVMNEIEAAEAANIIKPEIAIPIHYGKLENLKGDPELFKQHVKHSQVTIL
jgi:L-ascorbate metabolism protein UlaG (beta-lactamase superfamily)